MTDKTLPPSETEVGVEQINGTQFEYPYRITDWHGDVIREDLDHIPPFLDQMQVDILAAHLRDYLAERGLESQTDVILLEVLTALPDSESGREAIRGNLRRELLGGAEAGSDD